MPTRSGAMAHVLILNRDGGYALVLTGLDSLTVRAGDTVYLSGAVGIDANGKLGDGLAAQAKLAMDNLGAGLKQAGLGWGDVVKCTVMLDNMKDWPAFNQVYVTYFPDGKFPARSAFGADGLALGALLEVECIAYAGKK